MSTAAAAGTLDWKACKPGAVEQCATLTVPLDWSKPAGPTTKVYVAKVPAKDQKHKLGALFFNPGGPGGAGGSIFAAGLADAVLPQYRDRYDLVSFDPRGTGSSSQLDCGPVLRRGVPVFPKSKAQYDALVASSRATGEQCLKQHGDLMRNLDTRTVARDMDAIRAALGESKFNYLGLSYGSYLGTIYAQQFPQRVGRLVLDGILDHKQGALRLMLDQAREMEAGFDRTQGRQDPADRAERSGERRRTPDVVPDFVAVDINGLGQLAGARDCPGEGREGRWHRLRKRQLRG
ncbi:alpha/beta fold hydrolase [Kribbella sp. C-35]|uniref:alpha/beta fold hydrolase n=1 Tax=Kribbella sp. C-35 TaxID=2789276 RepID=UPI00397AB330